MRSFIRLKLPVDISDLHSGENLSLKLEWYLYVPIFPAAAEIDSAFNRNEYQEYFLGGTGGRCVGLTTLPPSCADCLEIREPQPSGTLRACPGPYRDCFTLYLYVPPPVTRGEFRPRQTRQLPRAVDLKLSKLLITTTPFHSLTERYSMNVDGNFN